VKHRIRSSRALFIGFLAPLLLSLVASCGSDTVAGPQPTAPTITAVSPNPIPGTIGLHPVTITGTNFVDKPTVIATWGVQGGGSGAVDPARVTFVSSTQLTVLVNVAIAPDTGSFRVVNRDNQSSQPSRFSIAAP
jgi:hypothetical protein